MRRFLTAEVTDACDVWQSSTAVSTQHPLRDYTGSEQAQTQRTMQEEYRRGHSRHNKVPRILRSTVIKRLEKKLQPVCPCSNNNVVTTQTHELNAQIREQPDREKKKLKRLKPIFRNSLCGWKCIWGMEHFGNGMSVSSHLNGLSGQVVARWCYWRGAFLLDSVWRVRTALSKQKKHELDCGGSTDHKLLKAPRKYHQSLV